MSNFAAFISYLNEQADNHSIYVWGAQGQGGAAVTEAWIRKKEKNTGGYASGQTYADAAVACWKKQCAAGYQDVLKAFDCSGLGVYWLYNEKHLFSGDKNANSMMATCKIIPFAQRKTGCWLFRVNDSGRATHIGYMIDNTNVVHAKGRVYGVVREAAKASYWHRCGIPAVFADEISVKSSESSEADDTEPSSGMVVVGKIVVDEIEKWCNVRSGPGMEHAIIGKAKKGDTFAIYGVIEGWYQIDFNGVVGYLYGDLASEVLPGNV